MYSTTSQQKNGFGSMARSAWKSATATVPTTSLAPVPSRTPVTGTEWFACGFELIEFQPYQIISLWVSQVAYNGTSVVIFGGYSSGTGKSNHMYEYSLALNQFRHIWPNAMGTNRRLSLMLWV